MRQMDIELMFNRVRGASNSSTLKENLATETSQRNSRKRCVAPSSRTGDARMKATGQSSRDPCGQMRNGSARHCSRFISSDITHLNPALSKKNPSNHVKGGLIFGTWNVLSLTSSSSQLFQESLVDTRSTARQMTMVPGYWTFVLPINLPSVELYFSTKIFTRVRGDHLMVVL